MSIKPAMHTPLGSVHQTRQNALYFMEACVEVGVDEAAATFNVQVLLERNLKPIVDSVLAIKDIFERREQLTSAETAVKAPRRKSLNSAVKGAGTSASAGAGASAVPALAPAPAGRRRRRWRRLLQGAILIP